ncbi:hypothetical protein YPPY13_1778 [Yersinia pestis PY-13]|uniref:Transposase n=1 Tax=Yersinia pestis PY-08 TaxID=992134 RepID=A0AB72ZLF7_YERPE|nr:hypothetical protein YpK1973002_1029 [Yersinia pestis biovar Mediaevalis str. K1973002]EIQ90540.1 hypothetical protein YPPY01_1685 [Yersinia pestis PY-01]EIQ92927.1 hypothetical protein YPPY03_1800 [Yersinia pestis PY-03]EIR04514.1 hypothetical protein YPPY04_1746 [Yersinia pestis PY-04]EIR05555.1 hypothetical protein YPPY05_1726 [Yersinia pestis PY-05]EIR08465.1 hypothetical protein YPPY06_1764 [Yersinia pestis PY-06]EIR19524.1 hypothetical protein YPPY07_1663 [Yersinia pestis PY-07]EIR2
MNYLRSALKIKRGNLTVTLKNDLITYGIFKNVLMQVPK